MSIQTPEAKAVLSFLGRASGASLRAGMYPGKAHSGSVCSEIFLADPLGESAHWDSLVAAHLDATIFHTSAWARVLHETYGHTPVYLCRQHAERPAEILPVMEVSSPLTGRRGVSLPFTDECSALGLTIPKGELSLFDKALKLGRSRGWKYFETRGNIERWCESCPSVSFFRHRLDLARSEEDLLASLESSVRRGLRKATEAGLRVEWHTDMEAVREYYRLHCLTRQRHGVPPQPFRFFEKICQFVLAAGKGSVFTASSKSRIVAAAVFFHFGKQALFKFGASDLAFQALRPNNLLMWEAIKWHARGGLAVMDFGRTSLAAEGLRRFKLGFGAREDRVAYCRYYFTRKSFVTTQDRAESRLGSVFRHLPLPALRLLGKVLYPHMS